MDPSGNNNEAMRELGAKLYDVGQKLLKLHSSTDELIILLEEAEKLLPSVPQNPDGSMVMAMYPALVAFIRSEILKHPDPDVQIAVAACINEMVRITAPRHTYEDEILKDIFPLFMNAFKHLSCGSGVNYERALLILECMARGQSCLIMLSIDLEPMIVEMFQLFLDTIRPHHCCKMFDYMKMIMILIIQESDDISVELLRPLLSSAKMDNKNTSPKSWELAQAVFESCAAKLQDYVRDAVKEMKLNVDDYAGIIASLCQDTPIGRDMGTNEEVEEGASVQVANKEIEEVTTVQFVAANASGDGVPKTDERSQAGPNTEMQVQRSRRRIKPNSLMSIDDGYYYFYKELKKVKSGQSKKRRRNQDNPLEDETGSKRMKKTTKGVHSNTVGAEKDQKYESADPVEKLAKSKQPNVEDKGSKKRMKETEGGGSRTSVGPEKEKVLESPMSKPVKAKKSKVKDKGSNKRKRTTESVIQSSALGVEKEKVRYRSSDLESENKSTSQEHEKYESADVGDKVVESPMPELAKAEYPWDLNPEKEKEPMDFSPDQFGQDLVSCRIMVWWPLDETYYTGTIESYDPVRKKHKIKYDDGDEEILNLSEERWELFKERQLPLSSCEREADLSPAKEHGKTQEKTTKRKAGSSKKGHVGPSSKRSKSEGRSIVNSRHSALESVPVDIESDDETFEATFSWKAKALSRASKK